MYSLTQFPWTLHPAIASCHAVCAPSAELQGRNTAGIHSLWTPALQKMSWRHQLPVKSWPWSITPSKTSTGILPEPSMLYALYVYGTLMQVWHHNSTIWQELGETLQEPSGALPHLPAQRLSSPHSFCALAWHKRCQVWVSRAG